MILVTGGAGYIGCVLVEELLSKGYAVRVFDKLFFGEDGLEAVRDKVDLVQGDVRNMPDEVLDNIDGVIHLAGLSNDPTAEFNPKANREMNTVATERLAKQCKARGIKRFTFASTCSIYDKGLSADDVLLNEDSEVEPRAAYAVSNYEAEQTLLAMADENFAPVSLRQGTVYGFSPRMRYDLVINTFVKDAYMKGILTVHCGGRMWRPLVDVVDVAKAHIVCLESPIDKVRGEIFNVAYQNFFILEVAHMVREALKGVRDVTIEVDYSHRKTRSYRVYNKKIDTVLGFRPSVSIRESVGAMVEQIQKGNYDDFLNPRYYNIQWMSMLVEMEQILKRIGSVFD